MFIIVVNNNIGAAGLWAVEPYSDTADVELANQVLLNDGQHDVMRPHGDVEDAPMLIFVQVKHVSNLAGRVALTTSFLLRRLFQHVKPVI